LLAIEPQFSSLSPVTAELTQFLIGLYSENCTALRRYWRRNFVTVRMNVNHILGGVNSHGYLMYVCPCIIYENDERYQLYATILFIIINNSTGSSGPQPQHLVLNTICSSIQPVLLKMGI